MQLTYIDKNKDNWYLVAWNLSNKCNYRCSYCPSFLNDGSSGWPEWNTVKQFIEKFNIPGKELCFRISGGEPTYWKHFLEMAKLVKQQGHIFSFLTNGSRSVEYYTEISEYSDAILLSYHPEYSSKEHFVNIIKNSKCLVGVNLMMTTDKFDELEEMAAEFYNASENVTIWPKMIVDKTSEAYTKELADYTVDQISRIKNWKYFRNLKDQKVHRGRIALDGKEITANDLMMQGLNNHKGWQCWSGLHMVSIDEWGNMYRSECRFGGKIGTIQSYVLPTTTITCGLDKCTCLSDVYLKKQTDSK